MLDLHKIQDEHRQWLAKNFPNQTPAQVLMGMTEELGEIAHAQLKFEQGIRGIDALKVRMEILDGLADLWIFSLGFADHHLIDMEEALKATWTKVQQRDWVANPETGGEDVG